MKAQLRTHLRLIILTGIALGLAILLYVLDPLNKFANRHARVNINSVENTEQQTTTNAPEEAEKPKPWEFPAGGREILPNYRLIALYGNLESKALGSLGEQSPDKAVARVKKLAAQYQPHSTEPIYPAFEIITTVASAGAGHDGDYSRETSLDILRPVIKLAKDQGVYVLLDLQPGHSDFLKQAKIYEEFLKEPHVGLALDPEWRLLSPKDKHMVRVGSVSAAEVSATAIWLADLVKENELPQKIFLLHQFKHSMITNRQALDTSRPELAWVIQMDGLGNQNVKQDTWRNIRRDAPAGIFWGWKNFIDEDKPMLTPKQTFTQVVPKPVFVSYQ